MIQSERGDFQDAKRAKTAGSHVINESDVSTGTAVFGPKRTCLHLTKYERARVLGTRAMQISMSAPILVDCKGQSDPLVIAELELSQRVIPFIIRRYLPDGSHEDCRLRDLLLDI